MEIHSIGYHHYHEKDFVIDRPDGIGQSWLFLIFKTKTLLRIKGKEIIAEPNCCIIYSGDEPEYYRACDEVYIDDWFHFTVEPLDIQLFRELNLPINTLIKLENVAEISQIIRTMTYEFYSGNLYSADIVELNMKMLFFRLSRVVNSNIRSLTENTSDKYNIMIALHDKIYNQVSVIGSVADMARELSLSVSDLQHTYKKIFGRCITDDIKKSRLIQAKNLLTTTNLPLKIIAERCGYSNEMNFMRHFKKHSGMTPTEYRNKTL